MRPNFSAEIIGELRRRAIAHNQATLDPRFHVKLGQLKELYKRGFKGKDPHFHALNQIDAYLECQHRRAESSSLTERPANLQNEIWTLPASLRIKAVLFPADFPEALKVAGIKAEPSEQAFFDSATAIFYVADKVISAQMQAIGQVREVGNILGEIQRACLTVSRLIRRRLPASLLAGNGLDALAHELSRSVDPVVIALRDAASALDGGEADGRRLALALLMDARLGSWSGTAREQYAARMTREKALPEDLPAHSPARTLGFALIESYMALTDNKPDFEGGGEPPDPLIRYLVHLFERARQNLSFDSERGELQHWREWNPLEDTLGTWIKLFRAGNRDA
jgi:hypothetical protein